MNKAKEKVKKVLEILKENYPDSKIFLNYSNNFELLAAVMLSAQTTDAQVNKVTKRIFQKYNKTRIEREEIENFANADIKTLENNIKSIGLYKIKAKNLKKTSQLLLINFEGRVPDKMANLLTLPGVGRKTANVVLSHAFNVLEGIAVDTHVKRLAFEFGLTKQKDPAKIEGDLMEIVERKDWKNITHLFISHGRKKDKKVDLLLREIKV